MITYLKGTLVEKQPTRIVVDVQGVGYEVLVPLSSHDALPSTGAPCHVLTYDYVREDTHQLFGFATQAERKLFVLLTGTTGIGPKLALSALSGLSVRELTRAIAERDTARLSSISGIGKKMAERLAVELADKIDSADALQAMAGPADSAPDLAQMQDAILALVALGYSEDAARKMITTVIKKKGDATLSVEYIIKHALAR